MKSTPNSVTIFTVWYTVKKKKKKRRLYAVVHIINLNKKEKKNNLKNTNLMVVFQLSNCNAYIINKCKGEKKFKKYYKQYPTIPAWLKQQVALNPNWTLWSVTTAFTTL